MAKTQTHLQVFVASPGDVGDERRILETVIREHNLMLSRSDVHLDLIKWETHTYPAIGADAQDVVNQQIGDEYDIFIGIMWGRFGSPTKRAESGTKEEFERALNRYISSEGSVQIMFYFKEAGIPPSKIDPRQLSNIQEFKRRIAKDHGVLYKEFETAEDFQTKVRMHLGLVVQDWIKANPDGAVTTPARTATMTSNTDDPLANLSALTEDEYGDSLIELSERGDDAWTKVTNSIQKMTDAINEVGEKFNLRTAEIEDLTAGGTTPDIKSAKRVSKNAANDLEVFVNQLSAEIPVFKEQHLFAMETFGHIAMISDKDMNVDAEGIKKALTNTQEYRNEISTSSESLSEFRGIIAGLPRMTAAFNRARRRAAAVMEDLLVQLRAAESQSDDVVSLLKRMANSGEETGQ